MSLNDKKIYLPLINGWTRGTELIIPSCPICGAAHFHGNVYPGYIKGEITTRAPHCFNNNNIRNVCIQVCGEMTDKEYHISVRRYGKPSKEQAHMLEYIQIPMLLIGIR